MVLTKNDFRCWRNPNVWICAFLHVSTVLIFLILISTMVKASTQTDITGGAGSERFGTSVTVLPNGNFVVTDPLYDLTSPTTVTNVGAVFLYSVNGTLISQLTGTTAEDRVGSSGVVVLSNGNFVVQSQGWDNGLTQNVGAVTWCSGTVGCPSTVSNTNSLIGATANDFVGGSVLALNNGNYVVAVQTWDNGSVVNVGAVTRCSGTGSTVGLISANNSLIGTKANDQVGRSITELRNSYFVVTSPDWDNDTISNVGAVTWLDGSIVAQGGTVSTANSLTGSSANDNVGGGITTLTNGNFLVTSLNWNGRLGAFTWGNGNGGTVGTVSAANSLVSNAISDVFGFNIVYRLSNGGYVISFPGWNGSRGAVVWGNPNGGVSGIVSSANSLVGTLADDFVGRYVVPLANGNYVVNSQTWNNCRGAVTFGNGSNGVSGELSGENSLVGTIGNCAAGNYIGSGGIAALTNGNYVVGSPSFSSSNGGSGAATWCNGLTGCRGTIAQSNSIIGIAPVQNVGSSITALTNDNYVVQSRYTLRGSISDFGVVTLCQGLTGRCAALNATESLIGQNEGDRIGDAGVTPLTNGNYVVASSSWNGNRGAVTFCNGVAGCRGNISAANSMVGSTAGDISPGIGFNIPGGVIALPNGNFVISNPSWDLGTTRNVGSLTWCGGSSVCAGTISNLNSLIGSTANDQIGYLGIDTFTNSGYGTIVLNNSNFLVKSAGWDFGTMINAGAITFGAGNIPITGTITTTNSVTGTYISSLTPIISSDILRGRIYFGRATENKITILSTTYNAISDGNFSNLIYDLGNTPGATDDIIIPSGRNIILDTNFVGNSLTIQSGATLTLNGNRTAIGKITVNGTLNLGGNTLNVGNNMLTVGCGAIINNTINGYIIGSLQRCVNTSSLNFPVGTANGASPVSLSNIIGTGDFTIKANQGSYQTNPSGLPANRLNRYWTLTNGRLTQADVTFSYVDSDILGGAESNFRVFKIEDNNIAAQQTTLLDTMRNTATVMNVTQFSDWTLAEFTSKTFDFDGDRRADISVFRSSDRNWYLNRSSQGFAAVQWGIATDKLAPADYDGDGKTDVAVWREGSFANFYVLNSADNTVRVEQFGQTGDVLTVGDWDGDGKADAAVYRDSAVGAQSYFYYRGSNNNPNRNITYLPWGTTGDKPQLGDFDNDGKTDLAVFRPSNAVWYIRQSSDSQVRYENWGLPSDKFVPADYDGDGKTDLAVFRNGVWYIRNSSNNQPQYIYFGIGSDIPVPADYDGDGKTDVAIFRNGTWYLLQSTSGVSIQQFGLANDKPVPAAFIP